MAIIGFLIDIRLEFTIMLWFLIYLDAVKVFFFYFLVYLLFLAHVSFAQTITHALVKYPGLSMDAPFYFFLQS